MDDQGTEMVSFQLALQRERHAALPSKPLKRQRRGILTPPPNS